MKTKCNFQLLAVLLVLSFVSVLLFQYMLSHVQVRLARKSVAALAISEKDDQTLKHLFKKFVETAEAEGVTYFMFYGTLLGSFRYNGRIPWDDDVDIMISYRDQHYVLTRFNKLLQPDIVIVETGDLTRSLKMFSPSHSKEFLGKTWRYPFLDIAFYAENETHIWDTFGADSKRKFQKSDIFPLSSLVYEGVVAYAPNNVGSVLKTLYGDYHKCVIPYDNHENELSWQKNSLTVHCGDL